MKLTHVLSLSALTLISSFSANAGQKALVAQATPTTRVALFRPVGMQPRCPRCATVAVALEGQRAIGAAPISKVVVNFLGREKEITGFSSAFRCLGSPVTSDTTFTLELPHNSFAPLMVDLTFYARNCMNPTVPSCNDLREVGRISLSANAIVNLQPTTVREAVSALQHGRRGACSQH